MFISSGFPEEKNHHTQNPALDNRLDSKRNDTNAVVRTMSAVLVAIILPC